MTKFGYIRVSSNSQTENSSLRTQEDALLKHGISKVNIFTETHTGTELNRPILTNLLGVVQDGDEIYVLRLDRFARNTLQALNLIAELEKRNIKLISLDFPYLGDKNMQNFFRTMILFFAEFENEQRKKRQLEGVERAKIEGKYKGRKAKINDNLLKQLEDMLYKRNYKKKDAALALNISRATLYKALKKLKNSK